MFYFTKLGRAKPLEFGTNVHSNKNKYYIHFQMYTQTRINMFLHTFPLFIYTSMYNSRFSLFFADLYNYILVQHANTEHIILTYFRHYNLFTV